MISIKKIDPDPWFNTMDGGPNARRTVQMVLRALVNPNTARVMVWTVNDAVHEALYMALDVAVYDAVHGAESVRIATKSE